MVYPEGLSDYYFPNGSHLASFQGWNAVGSSESNQQDCQVELDPCSYKSCKVSSGHNAIGRTKSWKSHLNKLSKIRKIVEIVNGPSS